MSIKRYGVVLGVSFSTFLIACSLTSPAHPYLLGATHTEEGQESLRLTFGLVRQKSEYSLLVCESLTSTTDTFGAARTLTSRSTTIISDSSDGPSSMSTSGISHPRPFIMPPMIAGISMFNEVAVVPSTITYKVKWTMDDQDGGVIVAISPTYKVRLTVGGALEITCVSEN